MRAQLLWKAREYSSLEHCVVKSTATGREISSVICGYNDGKIFRVDYRIVTNADWHTISVDIQYDIAGSVQTLHYSGNGNGNWKIDGKMNPAFDGCIDVDLPLTPFTNTLPVSRLGLDEGEDQIIKVIYFDIMAGEIKPVNQKYTRLSSKNYKYENVPNDFEAVITVDDHGFVVDYPQLFERVSAFVET